MAATGFFSDGASGKVRRAVIGGEEELRSIVRTEEEAIVTGGRSNDITGHTCAVVVFIRLIVNGRDVGDHIRCIVDVSVRAGEAVDRCATDVAEQFNLDEAGTEGGLECLGCIGRNVTSRVGNTIDREGVGGGFREGFGGGQGVGGTAAADRSDCDAAAEGVVANDRGRGTDQRFAEGDRDTVGVARRSRRDGGSCSVIDDREGGLRAGVGSDGGIHRGGDQFVLGTVVTREGNCGDGVGRFRSTCDGDAVAQPLVGETTGGGRDDMTAERSRGGFGAGQGLGSHIKGRTGERGDLFADRSAAVGNGGFGGQIGVTHGNVVAAAAFFLHHLHEVLLTGNQGDASGFTTGNRIATVGAGSHVFAETIPRTGIVSDHDLVGRAFISREPHSHTVVRRDVEVVGISVVRSEPSEQFAAVAFVKLAVFQRRKLFNHVRSVVLVGVAVEQIVPAAAADTVELLVNHAATHTECPRVGVAGGCAISPNEAQGVIRTVGEESGRGEGDDGIATSLADHRSHQCAIERQLEAGCRDGGAGIGQAQAEGRIALDDVAIGHGGTCEVSRSAGNETGSRQVTLEGAGISPIVDQVTGAIRGLAVELEVGSAAAFIPDDAGGINTSGRGIDVEQSAFGTGGTATAFEFAELFGRRMTGIRSSSDHEAVVTVDAELGDTLGQFEVGDEFTGQAVQLHIATQTWVFTRELDIGVRIGGIANFPDTSFRSLLVHVENIHGEGALFASNVGLARSDRQRVGQVFPRKASGRVEQGVAELTFHASGGVGQTCTCGSAAHDSSETTAVFVDVSVRNLVGKVEGDVVSHCCGERQVFDRRAGASSGFVGEGQVKCLNRLGREDGGRSVGDRDGVIHFAGGDRNGVAVEFDRERSEINHAAAGILQGEGETVRRDRETSNAGFDRIGHDVHGVNPLVGVGTTGTSTESETARSRSECHDGVLNELEALVEHVEEVVLHFDADIDKLIVAGSISDQIHIVTSGILIDRTGAGTAAFANTTQIGGRDDGSVVIAIDLDVDGRSGVGTVVVPSVEGHDESSTAGAFFAEGLGGISNGAAESEGHTVSGTGAAAADADLEGRLEPADVFAAGKLRQHDHALLAANSVSDADVTRIGITAGGNPLGTTTQINVALAGVEVIGVGCGVGRRSSQKTNAYGAGEHASKTRARNPHCRQSPQKGGGLCRD